MIEVGTESTDPGMWDVGCTVHRYECVLKCMRRILWAYVLCGG
jgi:hypothetical protein